MRAYPNKIGLFVFAAALATALFAQELPVTTKQMSNQASETDLWDLGQNTSDADISPDDRLLAITLESSSSHHEQIAESLEVWGYRQHVKVSSAQVATYLRSGSAPNAVRFTADGSLLAVTEPARVHVFETATLKPIRVIDPQLEGGFRIFHIETSPSGHLAIVAANKYTIGILLAYDLDDGRLLFQWRSPHSVSSISWNADGTQFAVAAPFLCTRDHDTVHVFSTNPWLHLKTLSARNPVSLAFSENYLYVVESSFCDGSAFDRHLGLAAFDIHGRKHRKTIFLPHKDIHDSVSFANGKLVANTGDVTTKHDWLDGTTTGVENTVQFTVWRGDVSSVEFTSPTLAIPSRGRPEKMRLSRTGKMVLLGRSPQVFQIP